MYLRRPLLVLTLLACCLAMPAVASDLADVRAQKRLVMLCFPQQDNPFVHAMVAEYGERGLNMYGGYDVELMRRFARHLEVELVIKPIRLTWADLIPALLRGEGDVVANAIGITEKRRTLVDFSIPYISSEEALVSRKDAAIHGTTDLDGKTAVTVAGSSHEDVILSLGIEDLKILYVDFPIETYQAVLEKRADFTVLDARSARKMLSSIFELQEQLTVATALDQRAEYGFAMRPGSDLKAELDSFLEQLIKSGQLEAILNADP